MLGAFIDIETSGLDPFTHVPLEIACVVVNLLSGEKLGSYESLVYASDKEWEKRDPVSISINGFSQEEIKKGKSRKSVGAELEQLLCSFNLTNTRGFFICQNPSFDRAFFCSVISPYRQEALEWPYHWLDLASMYWALKLYSEQTHSEFGLKVSKDSIAKSLNLPPEPRPHKAMNGVSHLLSCYEKLIGFPLH